MTRKPRSQAQRDAQINAMEAARGAAAKRAQARELAAREDADRAEARRNHEHRFGNWFYVLEWTHEVRECRDPECGFAEIRPLREWS